MHTPRESNAANTQRHSLGRVSEGYKTPRNNDDLEQRRSSKAISTPGSRR
jgi:hypothetical protein